MISTVIVTGLLKDIFDEKFRYIETKTSDSFQSEEDIVSLIPALYWTRDEINPLTLPAKDSFVIIQGHLESDEEHGLYVLVENIQVK